jgi:hypothetical protein
MEKVRPCISLSKQDLQSSSSFRQRRREGEEEGLHYKMIFSGIRAASLAVADATDESLATSRHVNLAKERCRA